jgi:hypothetical protein
MGQGEQNTPSYLQKRSRILQHIFILGAENDIISSKEEQNTPTYSIFILGAEYDIISS